MHIINVLFQAGRNVLEISGLSSYIAIDSPRILGLTGDDVRVVGISCTADSGPWAHGWETNKHGDEIRQLEAQLGVLNAELVAYQLGDTLINGLTVGLNGASGDGTASTQLDLVDAIIRRKLENTELVSRIEKKIGDLGRKLNLLRTRKGIVNATFFATRADCQADFQLTYRMAHSTTGWSGIINIVY